MQEIRAKIDLSLREKALFVISFIKDYSSCVKLKDCTNLCKAMFSSKSIGDFCSQLSKKSSSTDTSQVVQKSIPILSGSISGFLILHRGARDS